MNINFTGMQNVAAIQHINSNERTNRIAIQLNNEGEQDLDNFKQVLKKYPDFTNSGFLDLEIKTTPNRRYSGSSFTDVYVNSKKLEMNDENLPVFSKINNLLKRLAKGEEKTPVSEEYLKSEDCFDKFSSIAPNASHAEEKMLIEYLHKPRSVRTAANDDQKILVKILNDYCMSEPKTIFSGVKSVCGFSFSKADEEFDRLCLELNDEDKKVFDEYLYRDYHGNKYKDLNVDLVYDPAFAQSNIRLNGNVLIADEETIPMFQKLAELTSKISQTKEELPFPDNYMSSLSFNTISHGKFKSGVLENLHNMSDKEKEEMEMKFKVVKTDDEAKLVASKILKSVEDEVLWYFE